MELQEKTRRREKAAKLLLGEALVGLISGVVGLVLYLTHYENSRLILILTSFGVFAILSGLSGRRQLKKLGEMESQE